MKSEYINVNTKMRVHRAAIGPVVTYNAETMNLTSLKKGNHIN